MTVLSASISRAGTGGSVARSGERRYVVTYNVETDDPQDGVIAITEYFRTNPALPFLGSTYDYFGEVDTNSFCERIVPRKKDYSQTEWEVALEYQERDQRQDESGDPTGDPLEFMRQFSFFFNPRQVPVSTAGWGGICRKDRATGNRIEIFPLNGFYGGMTQGAIVQPVNAAGDPFDPMLLTDQSDLTFTCLVNLPGFDADLAQQMIDTVNDADVQLDLTSTFYNVHLKVYKWCMKIVNYGANFRAENWTDAAGLSQTTYYWEHQFDFAIREGITFSDAPPLGWRDWLPNAGYNRSARVGDPDGKGGVIGAAAPAGRSITARILDADDIPVSEPISLTPNGQPMTAADYEYSVEFSHLRVKDFTTIPGVGFTPWTP